MNTDEDEDGIIARLLRFFSCIFTSNGECTGTLAFFVATVLPYSLVLILSGIIVILALKLRASRHSATIVFNQEKSTPYTGHSDNHHHHQVHVNAASESQTKIPPSEFVRSVMETQSIPKYAKFYPYRSNQNDPDGKNDRQNPCPHHGFNVNQAEMMASKVNRSYSKSLSAIEMSEPIYTCYAKQHPRSYGVGNRSLSQFNTLFNLDKAERLGNLNDEFSQNITKEKGIDVAVDCVEQSGEQGEQTEQTTQTTEEDMTTVVNNEKPDMASARWKASKTAYKLNPDEVNKELAKALSLKRKLRISSIKNRIKKMSSKKK